MRTSQQVLRASLLRRLDDGVTSRRLTLIHAPAGYGKSSLLAQWHRTVRERSFEAVWLTLEEEESDALQFAHSLLACITGSRVDESTPLRTAMSAIVNRFVRTADHALVMLDDFQRCARPEVCSFLRTLIRLLPETVHLVIASRDRPNLAYAELAAEQDLLEIGPADLRFNLEEAAMVLCSAPSMALRADDVRRLVERTEGWPIAVQMTALSLRAGADRGERIAKFTGADWQLATYLSEQVLVGLPADIENVVTDTAILNRVNGELVNLLCGRRDGAILLEELERQDMFLVPLDAGHLTYRYHQLFAEILSSRLQRRDPERFRHLHRLAAQWFAAHSSVREAVRHALSSADSILLANVLDSAGGWRMIPEGRMDALALGLPHLSENTIAAYPRLVLAQVYQFIKQGEMDAARSRYDAFRKTAAGANLAPGIWTEINLVGEVLSDYENAPVRLEDLLAKEAVIRSLPSYDHLMLSNVYESLGSKYCECGWLERAIEPTRRAREHHQALLSLYGELFTHFLEARVVLAQGHLQEARVILENAAARIDDAYGSRSDLAANCAAHLAEVKFEQGQLSEATSLLAWALPHMEKSDGWFEVYASAFGAAIRATLATNPGETLAIIQRMRATARRRHLRQLELLADIHELEMLICAGRLHDALALSASLGLEEFADAMREEFPIYRQVAIAASLCRIKLRLCVDDHAAALSEIELMQRWTRQHGHGRLLISLAILAAQAHALASDARKATASFDEAVNMAMFQGFMGPFLDSRRFLVLPTPDEDTEDEGVTDPDRFRDKYLRRLRKLLRGAASGHAESKLLSVPELLTLRHLDKGYTNKEIARRLQISPNTVKYRLKSLFAKMGVTSRREAVQLSRTQGLLTGPVGTTDSNRL